MTREYKFANTELCTGFVPFRDNPALCRMCGGHMGNHDEAQLHEYKRIRDAFVAQLPIVAAIIYMSDEKMAFEEAAADAVALVRCIEQELGG